MEEKLAQRRITAENSFNTLAKQKDQKEAEIKEIDTELARLQGEYRLVDDLLKEKPNVSPEANIIDATPVDKTEKKPKK